MTDQHQPPEQAAGARSAYERRRARRAAQARSDTQAMRAQREALALAHALRRELANLADGAGDLARQADGAGRGAELARTRLTARRRRAQEALTQADRFGLDAGLAELEVADRVALRLPDS